VRLELTRISMAMRGVKAALGKMTFYGWMDFTLKQQAQL